jgi:hypothetical protein
VGKVLFFKTDHNFYHYFLVLNLVLLAVLPFSTICLDFLSYSDCYIILLILLFAVLIFFRSACFAAAASSSC